MKVLITGSSGFLGSALKERLGERSVEIVGFSTVKSKNTIVGDITNYNDVVPAVKDVDFIYHFAGVANVSYCEQNPELAMNVNAEGTKNILTAVEEYNPSIKGIVLASSIKVYGNRKESIITEETPINPDSVYARSKLKAEMYCMKSKIPTVIIRQSNVYGPTQLPEYVISSILNQSINSDTIHLRNAGASADFVYIDDILDAYTKIMRNPSKGIYNLSSGNITSLEEIIDIASDILDKSLKIESDAYKKIDSPKIDRTKFSKKYDWKPKTSIRSGIKMILKHYSTSS